MQIIHSFKQLSSQPIALTIGNFDGVHLGHQSIIKSLKNKANHLGYQSAVMTFSPHPKVFFKQIKNFLIDSDEEKLKYIEKCGTDFLYNIPFTKSFSTQTAEEFVITLIHQLNVKYLLVGDDFRFGHKGQGDFELLKTICNEYQVLVEDTKTVIVENTRVSSSRIRKFIKQNEFELVKNLLGRPYCYTGKVVKGRQIGRTIDFPTANLAINDTRIISYGVFAVQVDIEGYDQVFYGMCNMGKTPTIIDSLESRLEVHLFNFSENLYNKVITVKPIRKIRDTVKFENVDALRHQLVQDKRQVSDFFKLQIQL